MSFEAILSESGFEHWIHERHKIVSVFDIINKD